MAKTTKSRTVTHEENPPDSFMDEQAAQDRADAITDSIRLALKAAKERADELGLALRLGLATSADSDIRRTLEHARRVSGDVTTQLQETITRARTSVEKAGGEW